MMKDLEQEMDVPTKERHCCGNFVCCGHTNLYCIVLKLHCGDSTGLNVELCRRHMPSASLVEAETVQILVLDVLSCHRRTVKLELVLAETEVKLAVQKGKSRCRWLLEEMQPRTSNGWG